MTTKVLEPSARPYVGRSRVPVLLKHLVDAMSFKPGDAVFGDLSAGGFGGFAEYVCARADALALKPANISFEQAAAVPMAAVTALQGLRTTGQIQPGAKDYVPAVDA